MVADAFASYVADMLKQAVEDEVGMLLGVAGDIDNMGVKLGDLKNFLADADRRNITDQSVKGWVRSSSAPCTTPPTSSTTASSRPWIGRACPLRHHVWRAGTRCSSACGIPSMPVTSASASRNSTRSLTPSRSEALPLASSTLVPTRTVEARCNPLGCLPAARHQASLTGLVWLERKSKKKGTTTKKSLI